MPNAKWMRLSRLYDRVRKTKHEYYPARPLQGSNELGICHLMERTLVAIRCEMDNIELKEKNLNLFFEETKDV